MSEYNGEERRKHNAEFHELKQEVAELKESVDGLLTLWRDGVGAVRIIKFLAWLAGAIAVIIAGINIWGGK